MGGFSSKSGDVVGLKKTEEEIVKLMFPVFYDDKPLTAFEESCVERTWGLVLTDKAPGYLTKSQRPGFAHSSSITYFYDLFYNRLFDVHSGARDLFKDIQNQGKFLVKMISLALSEKTDPEKFQTTLTKLAEVHNERGVKAVEYGIVGEVLFWTLNAILGADEYNNEVHAGWVKLYSHMLKVMVPIAIAYELRDGSAQEKRCFGHTIGLSPAEALAVTNLEKKAVTVRGSLFSTGTVDQTVHA